jgi:DNA-binding beta-propeller fold protein YncE
VQERGLKVDDRQFDRLSRRVASLPLPNLPRRALVALLGSAALAGGLSPLLDPEVADAQKNRVSAEKKKKCKKEGKKCDKKKCKKKDKKCCCKGLKCQNDRCEEKGGGGCRTDADLNSTWTTFNSSGPDTFDTPWGIATDEDGNVYVTDQNNERVLVFNSSGSLIEEFGQEGDGSEEFQEPTGIAFNEDSNRIFVLDPGQANDDRKFRRFQPDGDFDDDLGSADTPEPNGIAVDADDRIWVVDSQDDSVLRFNAQGGDREVFDPSGNGALNGPQGIAVFEDDDDNATYVFVADTGNNRIVKFEFVNGNLDFVDEAGSSGDDNDEFNQPIGIAVDDCGNLWVADRLNNRIQQLDKDLNFESRITLSGNGFDRPTGVALSPSGNRLYVTDSENDRVVLLDLS